MKNKQNIHQDTLNDTEPMLNSSSKKERLKKQAAQVKSLFWYDVRVECMLPAVLTYKVLAETPQQAAELIKRKSPNSVAHKLIGRKELILKVYDSGCSMMKFMKKLVG